MIAVITGDIINSRAVGVEQWLIPLKNFLNSKITNSSKWEFYRGDSFQIEVGVKEALWFVIAIKALIKSKGNIDVRLAVGIGEKDYEGEGVLDSNGTAFIHSGESFETIGQRTMVLKSSFLELDTYFDVILLLFEVISNKWTQISSTVIYHSLVNKKRTAKEIAGRIGKTESSFSKALKRGMYDETLRVIELYSQKVEMYV